MANFSNAIEITDIEGIHPKRKWTLRLIDYFTHEKMGFTIAELYDYNTIKGVCERKLTKEGNESTLDEYMWEEITKYIEEARVLVYDTYRENDVNECESYFLSLKFLWSTLRKFRSKFFREVDSRDEYDQMPLKIAINHLMHVRLQNIMADKKYKYSAKAADGKLGEFRKNAAWETARYLAEDTGTIFHAKVTL
ncbi:MAG: hypothetical protein H8E61_00785 [Bacteroidetes bacterium]|nr:hypothetical protein [Bacteroidota bacterium]